MRDLDECRAEVFRRSESRIKERRRKRSRMLAICIPLVFCVAAYSIFILPAMLPVQKSHMPGDTTFENTGSSYGCCRFIVFDAQYIRTDVRREGAEYPVVKLIRSADELNAYYEANKEKYDLERREKVYSDTAIGFLDACDRYDEAYFEDRVLVLILPDEGSGSIGYRVNSLRVAADGGVTVDIETVIPEAESCDMAVWHILIEPEAGTVIENEADITVLIDGVNLLSQPTLSQHGGDYTDIILKAPCDGEY